MEETTTVEAPAQAPAPDPVAEAPAETRAETTEGDKPAEGEKPEGDKKAEKPWYEKRLDKQDRRIRHMTAQREQLLEQLARLQPSPIGGTNQPQQDDSEPLSLSRAEFERLAVERARQLAPSLIEQQTVIERRTGVYRSLESDLGAEKFAELSQDLEVALDGLTGADKRPKPLVDAIFDSESPRAVLEYLGDPDNADETAALSRMPPIQLGRAMAKLESKLAAKKAEEKPQPSKAAAVIEPIRGSGAVSKPLWDLEGEEFDKARREYIKRYRN